MNAIKLLHNAQQGHAALMSLWPDLKSHLLAGHRLELVVRPERRNTAQNALLHSLIGEIAKVKEWAGQKRDPSVWKRLLTAAWLRGRGESIEVLPAIDGHGIDVVFRRTSDLTKGECAELIDWITAWAIEQGVEFAETGALAPA